MQEEKKERNENKEQNKEDEKEFAGLTIVGKILILLCILFYFTGFLSTSFLKYEISLQVFSEPFLDAGILVIGVFLASIAFYGMLSPVIFFLLGVEHAAALQQNILLAVKLLPFLLAGYAGILLATFVKQDKEKEIGEWKGIAVKVIAVLAIAITLALILEYFSPEIAGVKITIFE